jgi:Big-like domain-containing protein
MRNRVLGILAIAALSACGGGGGGGGTPSGPSSFTSLSLTPATDLIRIRGSETFTATGASSDGSSRTVEGTWGSDAPGVATVSAGRVTGVTSGQATIFADYQGLRATRLLRVLPDYHGRWTGDHTLTGCAADGIWMGFCDDIEFGQVSILGMALTQNRDALTGPVDYDDVSIPTQGSIQMSGHLVLQGSRTEVVDGIPVDFSLSNWETVTSDNERMVGRLSLTVRITGFAGSLRFDSELRIMNKSSATPIVAATPRGGGGLRDRISAALRARKGG